MSPKKNEELPTEEKLMQQQLQLETELCNIRQEFLILDHDRENCQQYQTNKLIKSTKVFNLFKKEYVDVVTDLKTATTSEKKREDAKTNETLNLLLYQKKLYDEAVKTEKTYMIEVEDQFKNIRKSILAVKKNIITDRQHEDRIHNAQKTCALLENSLETQIKKFNLVCAKNRQSREKIDHLLWERRNFMNVWSKIINKLALGKKIMIDLIEQATIAYDQREDLCSKLQALRIRGNNDLYLNRQEMRLLRRKEDNLKKFESFCTLKSRKRIMKDLEEKEKQKRSNLKQKLEEKLSTYKNMLSEIMNFTKESSVESMARKYYNKEEENFMYFQYVNNILSETEIIGDNLHYLHLKIEDQRKEQVDRSTHQYCGLESLQTELKTATKESEDSEEDLKILTSKLDQMMEGISKLFQTCRCDKDPLLKLLGDNEAINQHNVLLHLQILEQTIFESLIQIGYKDKLKKISKKEMVISPDYKIGMQIYSIDEIVQTTPCALCIERELVSDVIDIMQVVWNKKYIKMRIRSALKGRDIQNIVHTTSRCQLPKARRMMQKRYE